jgi:hypothetical protein
LGRGQFAELELASLSHIVSRELIAARISGYLAFFGKLDVSWAVVYDRPRSDVFDGPFPMRSDFPGTQSVAAQPTIPKNKEIATILDMLIPLQRKAYGDRSCRYGCPADHGAFLAVDQS